MFTITLQVIENSVSQTKMKMKQHAVPNSLMKDWFDLRFTVFSMVSK